jgi:transposase
MAMTIVARAVTGGVDTHGDVHVAAALDELGALLGTNSFPATPAGYRALSGWLESFGSVSRVGIEGTGAYGAGLARHLGAGGLEVLEVDRPNRQARRLRGKSDPLDAIEAARSVLSGWATGRPKSRDGAVEAIRVLVVAKRSARQARIKALAQMRHLAYSAPEELRARTKGLSIRELVTVAAGLRPQCSPDQVSAATKAALCSLAHRVKALDVELAHLDGLVSPLLADAAPGLLGLLGVGTDTGATLLVTAGDNPERLRSEAAWAHLCGVAPLPASSGKVSRHRLDRGGDRQANSALWRIVMVRLTCDPETRAYVERRLKEGRSKREIIRTLKRYVAREVYHHLPRR